MQKILVLQTDTEATNLCALLRWEVVKKEGRLHREVVTEKGELQHLVVNEM